MMRALISVHNKEGIISFAEGLLKLGIEIIATSGTLEYLTKEGIPAVDVATLTGMPYILSGRVRTLHPKIHGGILADRNKKEHITQVKNLGLIPIDIVVVNLKTLPHTSSFEEIIENIDTGGPALLRSAAKNYKHVLVVSDPHQYPLVLKRLKERNIDDDFRATLALAAFSLTAKYDASITCSISGKLYSNEPFPPLLPGNYIRDRFLKHGENPHQRAAFYKNLITNYNTFSNVKILSPEDNLKAVHLLNGEVGWECVNIFKKPTVAIVKNRILIGVSVNNKDIKIAFENAYSCDLRANEGSVLVLNRPLTKELAQIILEKNNFFEGILAPSYEEESIKILKSHPTWGKDICFMEYTKVPSNISSSNTNTILKSISGGFILEDIDNYEDNINSWRIVTRRKPNKYEIVDMAFGLAIVGIIKSASAVISKRNTTVGIGCSQTSSFDAVALAISKAGIKCKDSVVALDEPCKSLETLHLAYESGITALIQPNDSSRITSKIIDIANKLEMCVVFCQNYHYKF